MKNKLLYMYCGILLLGSLFIFVKGILSEYGYIKTYSLEDTYRFTYTSFAAVIALYGLYIAEKINEKEVESKTTS